MADVNVPIVANVLKAKKIPAIKPGKKPSAVKKGPSYAAMVTTAIQELKEKKGSSPPVYHEASAGFNEGKYCCEAIFVLIDHPS